MALIKTLQASQWDLGVEMQDLYWRLDKLVIVRSDVLTDDGHERQVDVMIMFNIFNGQPEYGTLQMHDMTERVPLEELEAQEGDDLYAKAYNYIKTLEEYADAVDA